MKTIYQIKSGYNIIGSFESLDDATKLFAELTKFAGKILLSVSGKGKNPKYAHFFGNSQEFSLLIKEVALYPSKKEAEFAVFEGNGDDESSE